jgi:uncharacterized membrane protein
MNGAESAYDRIPAVSLGCGLFMVNIKRFRLVLICLIFLLTVPTLWANDLDDTISACGKPTVTSRTQDGQYSVEYKSHSIWLNYHYDVGVLRWYRALDGHTKKDLSREQAMKRLPCSEAMLNANAALLSAPATPISSSLPTESDDSNNWTVWVAIVILLGMLGGIFWMNFFWKPAARKFEPDQAVKCPKCHSTQVHAEKRGWSLLSGFIGSSRVFITCLKCGYKFKPGQGA